VTGKLPESALRFRVFIDGALVDEAIIDTLSPEHIRIAGELSARHQSICQLADAGRIGVAG